MEMVLYQMKKTSRSINHLIQNAEKGNLFSSLQLSQYYMEGKNVEEKNEELAKKYYKKFESELISKRIILKSLSLTDFRRFRSLSLNFDEKITVIIGDNGVGKTSILEALAKIFSWFNNNIEKKDVSGRAITESDINVNSKYYAEVTASFAFDKVNSFEGTLGATVLGYDGSSPTDVAILKQAASMYRIASTNTDVIIPLLAYYSVERSDFKLAASIAEKANSDGSSSRFSDLKTALDGNGKLEDFSKLYIELVNLAEGEQSKEVQNLKNQIILMQNAIDILYVGKSVPDSDPIKAKVQELKSELSRKISEKHSEKYQRNLNLLNNAIESIVTNVRNLHIDRSTGKPRLMVENFDAVVNINQLSQGQKMLVALIGDISRRLLKLNPDATNPLKAHGIVIIDEIELHLHPRWQQEILINLPNVFPNIQFIVTTHSPQILSTVDSKCIRQICTDEQGYPAIHIPKFQTKGVTSSAILDEIMGTNSIPQKVKEVLWVDDFYRFLTEANQDKIDSTLLKIKKHFGEDHPVVRDCESSIRIADMKKRLRNE